MGSGFFGCSAMVKLNNSDEADRPTSSCARQCHEDMRAFEIAVEDKYIEVNGSPLSISRVPWISF
jgi:hypothetical protein